MASTTDSAVLTSVLVAKRMLELSFKTCGKLYIIIDGLDECERGERKEISSWLQHITQELPRDPVESLRCLIVSQDDASARKDLKDFSTIKMTTENHEDLRRFTAAWQKRIECRFGELRPENRRLANTIFARAQGMFVFAELLAKFLENLPSREDLYRELDPAKFPIKLDHVYERIIDRIFESRRDAPALIDRIRQVLGWIVCAQRPLQWREIQAAVCIDIDQQDLNYDRSLLDSPKALFASLVELEDDRTVNLVHESARDQSGSASAEKMQIPHPHKIRENKRGALFSDHDDDIVNDLMNGSLAFYDYASSCWVLHLLSGIPDLSAGEILIHLRETLETFIEVHFVSTPKRLLVPKKTEESLAPLRVSESYDEISQAIVWSQKQFGARSQGQDLDRALDIPLITARIRSILEDLLMKPIPETDLEKLKHYYGPNWFKCPHVNCYYYHQGFKTLDQREYHIKRHERPYLCIVQGCHMGIFGHATKDEMRKHMSECHGVDMFEELEFPEPAKAQPSNTAKNPTPYACSLCPKSYTRNHNLQAHIRKKHQNTELDSINCDVCGKSFPRKYERDRHRLKHGDKPHMCFGVLSNGDTWGCKTSFARLDKLADHLKSKKGQTCIQPLLLEQLEKENLVDTETETEEQAELVPGILPSFAEFLRECGLVKEALKPNKSPPGVLSNSAEPGPK
ncbi:MAG: hypothetical protein Q9165_008738 [Trypethelium subeluteriae]